MATLTATEQKRLGVVRPELLSLLLQLMDAANAIGYRVFVPDSGGTRSAQLQESLYADSLAQGGGKKLAYPVGKPGMSRHEYGAAFDLHISGGTPDDYHWLATVGEQLGLIAGDFFDDRGVGKEDPYHFQLDETLEQSKAKWAAMQRAGIITREGLLPRPRSVSSSPRPPRPLHTSTYAGGVKTL